MVLMIFHFSGTGNTRVVALETANTQQTRLISVADTIREETQSFVLEQNEIVGFIYPIYGWGPPEIMLKFLKTLELKGYAGNYTFAISTSAAGEGYAFKILDKHLKRHGLLLHSAFSVIMPTNNIILHNTQDKTEQIRLLEEANLRVMQINKTISEHTQNVFDTISGQKPFGPFVNTYLINKYFNAFMRSTKPFHSTSACVSCGRCAKICPTQTICLADGRPIWGKNKCALCQACLHHCPTQAIQYGNKTQTKGRYTCPCNLPAKYK